LGIPGPVFNNEITIIANLKWPKIKGEEVAQALNMKKMTFLNDFVANGYGILSSINEGKDYIKINENPVDPDGPIAMIGAGTGLGHGYIVKSEGSKYHSVYPSEGGHQDFCPKTDLEWKYMKFMQNHFQIERISVERTCAGPALPLIFKFFVAEGITSNIFKNANQENFVIENDAIIKYGLSEECAICQKTLDFFNSIYGAAAGNMSLIVIPTGGLYLLGGLSHALESHITEKKIFMVIFFFKYFYI
jgi:glucokinase